MRQILLCLILILIWSISLVQLNPLAKLLQFDTVYVCACDKIKTKKYDWGQSTTAMMQATERIPL